VKLRETFRDASPAGHLRTKTAKTEGVRRGTAGMAGPVIKALPQLVFARNVVNQLVMVSFVISTGTY